jgi:hypothetical protein
MVRSPSNAAEHEHASARKRQTSSIRTHEPPLRNRSLRKADRTLASPISDFRKSGVNPQVCWSLLPLYPSFSGTAAGQFQPEQPWDGGLSGSSTNPLYHIDGRARSSLPRSSRPGQSKLGKLLAPGKERNHRSDPWRAGGRSNNVFFTEGIGNRQRQCEIGYGVKGEARDLEHARLRARTISR